MYNIWLALRWWVGRWTPKHCWYRLRLPYRRRRWLADQLRETAAYRKDPSARLTRGPAVVFGEFSGAHGIGRGAVYDLELVRRRHSHVEVVDLVPYASSTPPRALNLGGPIENAYFLCQPERYELLSRITTPDYLAGAYRIGRWVWETPLFPEGWRFAENLVHEVWAPSEFCAATFLAAISVPVKVVSHAVTVHTDSGIDMRARLDIPKDAFLGFAAMDIVSCPERKNPWDHIRAWKLAFGDDPQRFLLMKVRVGKRTRLVVNELRELIDGATNVRVTTEELDSEEIAALHRAADVYLSLHRSEGFGLNIYEALLLGKPTMATNFSANAEYGPSFPNYRPLRYVLTPYRDWLAHYPDKNFLWAAPNLEDAAQHLLECAEVWERERKRVSDGLSA